MLPSKKYLDAVASGQRKQVKSYILSLFQNRRNLTFDEILQMLNVNSVEEAERTHKNLDYFVRTNRLSKTRLGNEVSYHLVNPNYRTSKRSNPMPETKAQFDIEIMSKEALPSLIEYHKNLEGKLASLKRQISEVDATLSEYQDSTTVDKDYLVGLMES